MADIRLEPDESPEDLFQRLTAFVDDNLLRKEGSITHHGEKPQEDEDVSPTLENMIILNWLSLVHKDLPKLVKQRYGTELRSRTLASIRPEIFQAIPSLLDELRNGEDARVMRTYTQPVHGNTKFTSRPNPSRFSKPKLSQKSCPICKAANLSDGHYLSECKFLPASDRRYMVKARQIANVIDESDEEYIAEQEEQGGTVVLRVQVRQSPYIDVFVSHHPLRVTLDSGATGNMIRETTARQLGANITKSTQSAHQADGTSALKVVGETSIHLHRGDKMFIFEGLVVENLDVDVLAGTPFMEHNDITIRPAHRQVIFTDKSHFVYEASETASGHHQVRRTHIIRVPDKSVTIWPG